MAKNESFTILIISTLFLASFIALMVIFVIAILTTTSYCNGEFCFTPNTDAKILEICGPNQDSPCLYQFRTLEDCLAQCQLLENVCSAFTFNSTTSVMKIVDPSITTSSALTNLYVKNV